jgi:hypothetical protein
MATNQEQNTAADNSNPLLNSGVLQLVLSYVGPGHYLFAAPVSRWWRDIYVTLLQSLKSAYAENSFNSITICVPQMTLYSAAFASPAIVELAHEQGLDCKSLAYQRAAAKHADVATLAAAHALGMEYTAMTMSGAARCNKLAEVQYLHNQGCPWPLRLLEVVARSGYSELLRWCYEHRCPWQASTAPYFTAQSGNVELMAWVLQQPGTQLRAEVMCAAASMGRTAMCQYLREQQCPWNASSTGAAAVGGHVDLLSWLVDNGCPWDARQLCVTAVQGGSIEVLAYLQQLGLLTSAAVLTDMLHMAAHNHKFAAAKWLREQGAAWPTAFEGRPWRGEVLAWAVAEGFVPPAN